MLILFPFCSNYICYLLKLLLLLLFYCVCLGSDNSVPEVDLIKDWISSNPTVLSAAIYSGAEVVAYPFQDPVHSGRTFVYRSTNLLHVINWS